MLSLYGEKLDTSHPLGEYPRPQMVRDSYLNLNGVWQYAITPMDVPPQKWDGDIVVPFSPESVLSGVQRLVGPEDRLWYRGRFALPDGFLKDRLLLHFGGVDRSCTVWLNGEEAGGHQGGFLPFCLDVTEHLKKEGEQELLVRVTDPTDTAPWPRGRQRLEHSGPWHSPMSGIWQTVWLESVPKAYIGGLKITPLYDTAEVEITMESGGGLLKGTAEIYAGRTLTATLPLESGRPARVALPGALSWQPKNPFLYTVKVRAGADCVDSYFGMRKISVENDSAGRARLMLNNRPFFGVGVVDQGMYPDGLYTAPTDEAMQADIRFAKESGFNMIRKHGKVEPLRWYHHCDKLGMLVWQDIPGGGAEPKHSLAERVLGEKQTRPDRDYARFGRQDAEGRKVFLEEMEQTAALLHNSPSVGVWVLFQNGYGQFDAKNAAERMKKADPTRLVDHACGRYDQGAGDIISIHMMREPNPKKPFAMPAGTGGRAPVITEAGGFGLVLEGHFAGKEPVAVRMCETREAYALAFTNFYRTTLLPLAAGGISGFFFFQLSDTEDEVNGLLTADRACQKLNPKGLARLNGMLGP